jgi:molecular chaperone HtpG
MVADKVEVHTCKAGTGEGTYWESAGDGQFTIDNKARPDGHGTTIVLHLKKFDDDESAQDFTDQWVIKGVIKKYSDFIEWPIKMKTTRDEPELDEEGKPIEGKTKTVTEDETLNSQKAIWLRSPNEISDDEYNEFYKHVGKDWTDPLDRLHYKAEGTQEFAALLFVPSQVPFDYNYRDSKWGLTLYVNRVFIMDHCEDLIPSYMRFMKGVIDSSDLSLNVSREILQKDRQIQAIRKALTTKLLKHFKSMLDSDREKYEKFWNEFGGTFKEGIANDIGNKEKIEELTLFRSSKAEGWTTLKEYVDRMQSDQKEIYYITGESIKQVESSPYLEKLKQKDYEVLYCTDPVDEWVMQSITKFDDKHLRSITKEGLDLDSEEEKKQKEETRKEKEKEFSGLIDNIKKALGENIKEVKISDRLVDSPVCLVSGAYDPTARMERMMNAMGQSMPKAKRILEINPDHPVFAKMQELPEGTQEEWAEILYNQALLNEGSTIEDPLKFSRQISNLMTSLSQ